MKLIFILLSSLLLGCLLVRVVSGQEWNKNEFEGDKIKAKFAQKKQMVTPAKADSKINKFASSRKSLTTNTNTKCSKDCDYAVPVYKGSSKRSFRSKQQVFKEPQGIDHTAKEMNSLFFMDYSPARKRPPHGK
ncbi:hypothetical protein MtrunA17_Chr7g0220401 [Medicago truncatula]|uniref:Uncharacterized protein n=1 Tax=Medicago truncatula TaxID=3880 RepID=G7KRZ6_MEDTR|nr:hypothetical protein MTR_7g017370 [Medicago truncatula]RHN44530.1 hypothetical protein MtrunA17_Chr7g0220401 [Medicago truncatula]